MESNFQGDLADIFRPGSVSVNSGEPPGVSDWQYFDQEAPMMMIQEQDQEKSTRIDDQDFGQPFTSLLADPLIHEGSSLLFQTTDNSCANNCLNENLDPSIRPVLDRFAPNPNPNHNHNHNHNHNRNHDRERDSNRNHNIFSKMLQISPANAANINTSTGSGSGSGTNSSSAKRTLLEAGVSTSSLQISSPRNPGIKRRKNQAKKVVCIPAPTPANSRPTGEVVPSDLWAWRKYGQKPIKGSPYPRGYYRCSSSKGCSARKQVERSRTDPNMLVITYTSEHNHPWPTQRNALAGSTRTPQPPKPTTTTAGKPPPPAMKDEPSTLDPAVQVKDELEALEESFHHHQGYRPEFLDHGGGGGGGGGGDQTEDYFSGLGELEVDPISLLLNQGFLGGDEEEEGFNKDMNPFD